MIYHGKNIGYVKCAWCKNEATTIGMLQKICDSCLDDLFQDRMKHGR